MATPGILNSNGVGSTTNGATTTPATTSQPPAKKQFIYSNVRPAAGSVPPAALHKPATALSSVSVYSGKEFQVDENRCQSCGATTMVVDEHQGEVVCTTCGVTAPGGIIDTGTEWRTFADDGSSKRGDMSRVGGFEDQLLEEIGLGTMVARNVDGSSSNIARTHIQSTVDAKHRYLIDGFKVISKLGNELGLSRSIVDRAEEIFKKSSEIGEIKRSWRIQVVGTACTALACRMMGVPRTLNELCATSALKKSDVGKCFKELRRQKVHRHIAETRGDHELDVSADLDSMVDRFCSQLNLKQDLSVVKAAQHILRRANALNLTQGRHHASVAAGAIYLATQLKPEYKRSYKDISTVAHIAANTIQNVYRDKENGLYRHRVQLVSRDYVPTETVMKLAE